MKRIGARGFPWCGGFAGVLVQLLVVLVVCALVVLVV